jgi:hypothetical protein
MPSFLPRTLFLDACVLYPAQTRDLFMYMALGGMVRLLERGVIPYRKVGTHQRVRFKDLLAYIEAARKRGEEKMNQLIQESQGLGLYRF